MASTSGLRSGTRTFHSSPVICAEWVKFEDPLARRLSKAYAGTSRHGEPGQLSSFWYASRVRSSKQTRRMSFTGVVAARSVATAMLAAASLG